MAMDEAGHFATEMPNSVQGQDSEKGVDHISSLNIKPEDNEFKTVLAELEALPFHDENQRTVFFENVNRLQDRHIIQIFRLGVVPLQTSTTESYEFLEDVMKLFTICFSFCYTTDVSKRVAFEYYAFALKFCFRPQPVRCLATKVLSSLLELVQIFQEGNLATIVCDQNEQLANPKYCLKGAKNLFVELLEVFERRRDDGYIVEIIDQTKRFASADSKASCIEEHLVGNMCLRSDYVVSPLLLTNWINLLKLENISSGFASALAKQDTLRHVKEYIQLRHPGLKPSVHSRNVYESVVCAFVEVLKEMSNSDSKFRLPDDDEERLEIFFKRMHHFRQNKTKSILITSLKLLATTSIPTDVLQEILEQFIKEEKQQAQDLQQLVEDKATAFNNLFKVLSLVPDGKIVSKVLKFWKETSSTESDYLYCRNLLALFVEEPNIEDRCGFQERAERTLNFLYWLPSYLLRSTSFWVPFLSPFIRAFPTSFHKRPEALVFIHKAMFATRVLSEVRQDYVTLQHVPQWRFLTWISQQSFSEETKNEMISLLLCCTDGRALADDWNFAINVIKQLALSQELPFSKKKLIAHDITRFAKLLQDKSKVDFQHCVENVISNQTPDHKDDILLAILDLVKRFDDKKRPIKTIPRKLSQLLSLISQIPISVDRRLTLLQMAKESEEGTVNSRRISDFLQHYCCGLKNEEADEYFDVLVSVFDGIPKGRKDLYEQFGEQVRKHRPPLQVWTQFAQLILSGSFKEEIDGYCCCRILNASSGLSSSEMLQLFSELRSCAKTVVELLTDGNDIHAFTNHCGSQFVPETFVSSVEVIVWSKALTGTEKLLSVKKVGDLFLKCPKSLLERSMENALSNLIPLSCLQNNHRCVDNEHLLRLEFNHIESILDNRAIMAQLSKIPAHSLCKVVSKMNSDSFSANNIAEIYHFIGSLEDLDQTFFETFLTVLEVAIRDSSGVEHMLQILKELVCIVRATPSELVPLTVASFGQLLENRVGGQERRLFLNDVVMKWDFSPNVNVLSYLEVPRLLWKVYTTCKTPAERNVLIARLQEILKRANESVASCCLLGLGSAKPKDMLRKVRCCEFEWLVLHSPLAKEEAALAFNLIFHRDDLQLKCFRDFSDVYIEDHCFKFVPQGCESETENNVSDEAITNTTLGSTRNASSVTEPPSKILTPLFIAEKVIHNLKRLIRQNEDLTEKAFSFWDRVFVITIPCCWEQECQESSPASYDSYLDVILSILSESLSTEILFYWIDQGRHHVCQCSEVIFNACKPSGFTDDVSKEAVFKFQGSVGVTMEKMRLDASSLRIPVSCFRFLIAQVKSLSNLLEFRLPIEVKTATLEIFQTDMQAGVAIGEMLSFWSCKQQAQNLVERFKEQLCKEEEFSSLNPTHRKFVWQLLKAFGRFCINSCEDVLDRFDYLSKLYDPEDPYHFNRLPQWRQTMLTDGYSAKGIDCWCVAFLMTPPEDISSRDVDSILHLNSGSLKLVESPLSETIERCVFPTDGFHVSQKEGIKRQETRERLRLVKLLSEFITILKFLKPEENRKDAVIKKIAVDGCNKLCEAHESQARRNQLYIIYEEQLKALFTEVFGTQHKLNDDADIVCMNQRAADALEGLQGSLAFSRQSSYLHENLHLVMSHREVYQPLTVLLRRWLSRVVAKPNLASLTLEIVRLLFSEHSEDQGQELLFRVHRKIQDRILSLENNQALMAQLQASGYNQNSHEHPDLWSSPNVECSGYLRKLDSPDSRRYTKKPTQLLRRLWSEWTDILSTLGVTFIKVGENDMPTQDLFGLDASLEEMEQQVSAVKETVNRVRTNFPDQRIQQGIEQMIRMEQRHRSRIRTLYKGTKVRESNCVLFNFYFRFRDAYKGQVSFI